MRLRAALLTLGLFRLAEAVPGFPLLLFEPDARSAALGESALATSSGLAGLHGNPAALAGLEGEALALYYVDHLQDLQVVGTGWGTDRLPGWKLGLGLLHEDYGDLDGMDDQGNSTGSFSAASTALKLIAARDLGESAGGTLRAGVTGGWFHGSIDDAAADALTAGAGLAWTRGQLSLGTSVRNMGVVLSSYGETDDRLPTAVEAGGAWRLAHLPFTLHAAWERVRGEDPSIKLGGEFVVASRWRLDLGYQVAQGDDRLSGVSGEGLRGFSLGVGGELPHGFQLAWGWSSRGELGALNRLSLGWRYR